MGRWSHLQAAQDRDGLWEVVGLVFFLADIETIYVLITRKAHQMFPTHQSRKKTNRT
jgi:hypothetical protein